MTKGQPIDSHRSVNHNPKINKLFKTVVSYKASDLHLKVGLPPKMRIDGVLKKMKADVLTEDSMEELIFDLLTEEQKKFFLKKGSIDFAHALSEIDRFRVNVFRQKGYIGLVARRIDSNIPPFEKLNLPPIIRDIAEYPTGLVLVVGPTGSGKSTTIASMIDKINRERACHIVTIEDPIEYVHQDRKANVNQREVGIDCVDFKDALRSLMRQDPDVVLVGEIRDVETLEAAMQAAETGHLVFGTLHAASASQTIQRILDMFPQEERELARQTFALTVRGIIAQMLLPSIDPTVKRVPALEIMVANPSVRKLLKEEREDDIPSVIRSSQNEGMQDLTESLRMLIEKELIDLDNALTYAPNKEELRMAIKGIRANSSAIL
ncbi:type IV pilus twitching motility protein PilT [Sedimentisphaera salicampi]|uniref:type IV pilus twitching motility protein PilT n=1 Tax=Sedimentisphaera salicampi TaxID=1941349 RepID=UPI000B9B469F|nr:PilT/PilU family type 4a pilus ATPase [Sedimentisphaera salicampi]OXU14062.1 Twitching mobility protein [Sedimentisphaera salicampi]